MAIAYSESYNVNLPDSFNLRIKEQNIDIVKKMINRNINTSYGCGIGRLFDAVASLTGITDFTSYQAQAPLKLESIASGNFSDYYEFEESSPLDNSLLISSIINDINSGIHVSDISAKFHNTLARKIFIRSASIIEQYDIPRKVILSGGCFQNKRLTSQVYNLFIKHNIQPYIPSLYPCNDSGISFGQAVILSNIK